MPSEAKVAGMFSQSQTRARSQKRNRVQLPSPHLPLPLETMGDTEAHQILRAHRRCWCHFQTLCSHRTRSPFLNRSLYRQIQNSHRHQTTGQIRNLIRCLGQVPNPTRSCFQPPGQSPTLTPCHSRTSNLAEQLQYQMMHSSLTVGHSLLRSD